MFLPSAGGAELEVQRDDDKCTSLQTRPILLGDHLSALRLSRVDPVLRWIFGIPC